MCTQTTVSEAVQNLTRTFHDAGFESARRDAKLLVLDAVGITSEQFLSDPDFLLSASQQDAVHCSQRRRLQREPVTRIIGRRDFYGRSFEISPDTLDPRPDTETVIELVLGVIQSNHLQTKPLRIIDVGTGSGILLLTLLAELPHASGIGTDINEPALEVAKRNAERLGLSPRADFQWQDGIAELAGPFDILVSNPPYIRRDQIAKLAPEVRNFDPHVALDGGDDGLSFYRAMAPYLSRIIPNGIAAFEIGYDQHDEVVDILRSTLAGPRAAQITVKKDLAGHPRCVALETQP